jgi:hypothetical protein
MLLEYDEVENGRDHQAEREIINSVADWDDEDSSRLNKHAESLTNEVSQHNHDRKALELAAQIRNEIIWRIQELQEHLDEDSSSAWAYDAYSCRMRALHHLIPLYKELLIEADSG